MAKPGCLAITTLLLVSLAFADTDQSENDREGTTILQLMLERIVPASDILWSAYDPETDEEWQALERAAQDLISAFESTRQGGAGQNDSDWAQEQKFQAYIDEEIEALSAAMGAIQAKNPDALFEANDALYMPCESCHIDYNPRLQTNK